MSDYKNYSALNLGCGNLRFDEAFGVDISEDCNPDLVYDLNVVPWPFEDNHFDKVIGLHVIEHVSEPYSFISEIHRVCKNGAYVEVETPHYSSQDSWNDITHKFHFGVKYLQPFYKDDHKIKFELLSLKLSFGNGLPSLMGRLIAGLKLHFYEKYFSFIFPARNINTKLKVMK
jgi:SAM-dependent methyltransferase